MVEVIALLYRTLLYRGVCYKCSIVLSNLPLLAIIAECFLDPTNP